MCPACGFVSTVGSDLRLPAGRVKRVPFDALSTFLSLSLSLFLCPVENRFEHRHNNRCRNRHRGQDRCPGPERKDADALTREAPCRTVRFRGKESSYTCEHMMMRRRVKSETGARILSTSNWVLACFGRN